MLNKTEYSKEQYSGQLRFCKKQMERNQKKGEFTLVFFKR